MKIGYSILFILVVFCISKAIAGCNTNRQVITNDVNYDSICNIKIDSVKILYDKEIDKLINIIKERDSVITKYKLQNIDTNLFIDSINEELLVAKYKLERIEYYNKIAAKDNNIKFLRGWINRVIKE